MPAKLFRDPVHGNIEVDESELRIIDLPQMQRLRRIHQLALTHLLYPGSEHSRFGHSLGAMEIASRMFDQLAVRGGGLDHVAPTELQRQRRLLRLAALLHDVGHSPFSHALESEGLFADKANHERIGVAIIDQQLRGVIDEVYGPDISARNVIDLLEHELPADQTYLWQIISGPLDADKMDYLLRDAHYCGVRYGTFDLARILSKLRVHELPPDFEAKDRVLGLAKGATEAYETFFLARYWMNAQVYLHEVRRQLDIIVRKVAKDALPGGTLPTDLNEYLSWHDERVLMEAERIGSEWFRRLSDRRFFFVASRQRSAAPRTKGDQEARKAAADAGDTAYQRHRRILTALQADEELRGRVYEDKPPLSNKDYSERGDRDPNRREANEIPLFVVSERDGTLIPVADDSVVIPSLPATITNFYIFVDREREDRAREIVSRAA